MNWGKVLLLALIATAGLTAYAIGASNASENVVLCASKKGGALSLAAKGGCAKGQKKLTIAKQGPVGPTGPAGPAGSAGPQGPAGVAGADAAAPTLEPPHFVAPATTACAVQTGSFCVTETGLCWDNGNTGGGTAPVSFRKDADGFVHIEGSFTNFETQGACGGNETRPVFYLPQGFRPGEGTHRFAVADCSGYTSSLIVIETNGLVSAGSEHTACFDLSGIVFHSGS